jgi:hypothetical protein
MDLLSQLNTKSLELLQGLNDDQRNIAAKIISESINQGVNPNFTLPMVKQESNFNPEAKSKTGAIGVMQLMKDTASGLKVDPNDVDQNISGGIKLIKELSSNKLIGDDPIKILAGYNTSSETRKKFLETGDVNVLPNETLQYITNIASHAGDTLPSVFYSADSGELSEPKSSPAIEQPEQQVIQGKEKPLGEISPVTEAQIASGLGYKAGVGAGVAKMGAVKLGQKAWDYVNNKNAPQQVSSSSEKGPTHGGENWVKSLTNVDLPNGQMQKSDLDLAKGMQAAVGRNGEPGFTGGKVTEGGILVSPQTAAEIDAAKAPKAQSKLGYIYGLLQHGSPEQKELAAKVWSGIGPKSQEFIHGAQSRLKNIPSVGGFGSIGYGAGMAVPSAIAEYQKGNVDTALGNLGTGAGVGAGLAMVPKAAPIIGTGLSALDIGTRLANNDPTGAAISSAGVLGPLAAGALLAPPVGIPVAIAAGMAPAAINAYRDYVNASAPKKKAGAGRGFVNPEPVQ